MTCEWPISYAECATCEPLTSSPASGLFEEMAVDFLRNWTSNLLGACEFTVRPCREKCGDDWSTFWGGGPYPAGSFGGSPWRPVLIEGRWLNISCGFGGCGDVCSCTRIEQIVLPGPIASITSIQIDGVVLDPSKYRVDNHKYLVRTDGGIWPVCQDMSVDDGAPGTWSVTYKRGVAVPVGGQVAAGILACEFAKAMCNDSTCRLPRRVQNVTRQGVTIGAIIDSFDDLRKGGTGIWMIDNWVASMTQPKRSSTIASPDFRMNRTRRET